MGFYSIYKIIKDMIRTLFGKTFLKIVIIGLIIIIGYTILSHNGVFASTSYTFNSTSNQFYCNTNIPEAVYDTLKTISYYNNSSYHCILYQHVYPYRVLFTTDNVTVTLNNNLNISGNHFYYWYNFNAQGQITSSGSQSWNNYYDNLWSDVYTKQLFRNVSVYDEYDRLSSNYIWGYDVNPYHPVIAPSLVTSSSSIVNWSFSTFDINLGTLGFNSSGGYYYGLQYAYNGQYYDIDIKGYYNSNTNTFVIPRDALANSINIRDGQNIDFWFIYRVSDNDYFDYQIFNLGTFTFSLTSQEQTEINEDNNTYILGQLLAQVRVINGEVAEIVDNVDALYNNSNITNEKLQSIYNIINSNNSSLSSSFEDFADTQAETNEKLDDLIETQQETNEKIEDINNTITDSHVDNIDNNTLPQDTTTDATRDILNGIFSSLYNAFCTGDPQNIVLPIPNTDKSIIIEPNYIRNMLTSSNSTWVIFFIEAFWWYMISRFIIKDIANKYNKIKGGDVENVETSNIKGDML